jgi:hypothetical protein
MMSSRRLDQAGQVGVGLSLRVKRMALAVVASSTESSCQPRRDNTMREVRTLTRAQTTLTCCRSCAGIVFVDGVQQEGKTNRTKAKAA